MSEFWEGIQGHPFNVLLTYMCVFVRVFFEGSPCMVGFEGIPEGKPTVL